MPGNKRIKESRTEGIEPFGTALFLFVSGKTRVNLKETRISPGSPRQHSRMTGQNRREDGGGEGKMGENEGILAFCRMLFSAEST